MTVINRELLMHDKDAHDRIDAVNRRKDDLERRVRSLEMKQEMNDASWYGLRQENIELRATNQKLQEANQQYLGVISAMQTIKQQGRYFGAPACTPPASAGSETSPGCTPVAPLPLPPQKPRWFAITAGEGAEFTVAPCLAPWNWPDGARDDSYFVHSDLLFQALGFCETWVQGARDGATEPLATYLRRRFSPRGY